MSDTTGSPGSATDGPGDPSTSSPSADAPPSEPADDTPVDTSAEPGAGADGDAEAESGVEVAGDAAQPVAVPGEQIEWQPVSTGDSLTWQPVVAGGDGGAGADWEAPDDAGEWTAAGATAGAAGMSASANGAAGAGYDPEPTASAPPRAGAGPKSVAARRRAQAAAPPAPPAGDGPPPAADKTRRQVILLSVLTVAIVLVGVLAFVLSRGALNEGEEAEGGATTPTSTRTAPTIPDAEMQGYRDDAIGFSLRYPKAWPRLVPPTGDIRLVVQASDSDGFSVRVLPIQTEATEANIGNFKAVTDAVVFGDQRNKLIQEQLVRVNNRLAYYYLYTFEDEISRNQGVHAHYFIFEGLRIFSVVFQSVPADDFARQAGIWDQIAESFQAEPPRPGATTTTPPTTTG